MYFGQIIAGIPGPSKKDMTLPALQEIIRNAVSMRRQRDSEEIADTLLEASHLIQRVLETCLDDQSTSRSNSSDWMREVSGYVPKLKEWDFTYGTLDCAIQLARAFSPSSLSPGLQRAIQRLVFDDSSDQYFRWQAVSNMNLVLSLAYRLI